jgi:hypothetical protein
MVRINWAACSMSVLGGDIADLKGGSGRTGIRAPSTCQQGTTAPIVALVTQAVVDCDMLAGSPGVARDHSWEQKSECPTAVGHPDSFVPGKLMEPSLGMHSGMTYPWKYRLARFGPICARESLVCQNRRAYFLAPTLDCVRGFLACSFGGAVRASGAPVAAT